MSVLEEIYHWTLKLPAWQRDAVARLLAKQMLEADDLDDLFALLKAEYGIPDPQQRTPTILTKEQIPVSSQNKPHIALLAIKNLRHVNAIAENKWLPFGESGLTVIYGDNGSGKSGYSRVFKCACRARDQEVIHPNAHSVPDKVSAAEADFEIKVNGAEKNVHWTAGRTSPQELSSLAIFDARCARIYLDKENDVSYIPYGLDVLEALATLCGQLKDRLEAEQKQFTVDLTAFRHLHGDTEVGKLVSTLSRTTPVEKIEMLATLTPEEIAQHTELKKNLQEANPKEKAKQLRFCAGRITTLAAEAGKQYELVDQATLAKLRNLSERLCIAQDTAEKAAGQFKESEDLLPGTGGTAWRALYNAAREFALKSYSSKEFPNLGADAPCPLCQQPLDRGGAERLLRFEAFIQQEAEKTVRDCKAALDAEFNSFTEQVLSLHLDDATYSEIKSLDQQLADDTRAFKQALAARQEAVRAAVRSHKWEGVYPQQSSFQGNVRAGAGNAENSGQNEAKNPSAMSIEPTLRNPARRLQALAAKLTTDAETLEKASDEQARIALKKRHDEFEARIQLSKTKVSVLSAISRLIHQAKLERCLEAVRTHKISAKSSELAERVISQELVEALNREFKNLGVNKLKVSPQIKSDKGKVLHKLKLKWSKDHNPRDILSEGEQRAVAIGSFLAEVSLNGGKGGIIFDDPVSSFDHRQRERVAKRLATEAKQRQVIVFTHDIHFLCLLQEEAHNADVPIMTQSLVQHTDGFGIPDSELPFEGQNTAKRIGVLKNQHQCIAKLYADGNEQERRKKTFDAYCRLRRAWERAIEEVLLNKVVLRFRKGIETQRLGAVIVEDSDYAQVYKGIKKCSHYVAHDPPLSRITVPDPDELLDDIKTLESWLSGIRERNQKIKEMRKKQLEQTKSIAAMPVK